MMAAQIPDCLRGEAPTNETELQELLWRYTGTKTASNNGNQTCIQWSSTDLADDQFPDSETTSSSSTRTSDKAENYCRLPKDGVSGAVIPAEANSTRLWCCADVKCKGNASAQILCEPIELCQSE